MAFRAIAAMSLNRVIGKDGKIPWRIPAEMRWFKKVTMGHAVLMGRKTFESIGKPLPGRRNLVATRGEMVIEGVEVIRHLEGLRTTDFPCDVMVIGGEEIYRQMLPRCEELLLSVIRREVDGDVFFPEFEPGFDLVEVMAEEEFEMKRYRNSRLDVGNSN